MAETAKQFLRAIQLVLYDSSLDGLDLSELRIKFSIKQSDNSIPNTADIRVYNLSEDTAILIRDKYGPASYGGNGKGTVLLQGGYDANFGVIFEGNIKQIIIGRESATDTFIDIVAGDGDRAYNFAIVNATIDVNATPEAQLQVVADQMAKKDVAQGSITGLPQTTLPRGKVMFGAGKNYLTDIANTSDASWSIQNQKLNFVPKKSYLPGDVVVMNSDTGMVGTPQQTVAGVNVKCLLNPTIAISGRIQIDNASIEKLKVNLTVTDAKQIGKSIPVNQPDDGVYYVMVIEHEGDTRGVPWYSNLICLTIDPTSNPANAVQPGYGQ